MYGHLLKEVHSEEAKKLDAVLGYDKTLDSKPVVRSLLEESTKKALTVSVSA